MILPMSSPYLMAVSPLLEIFQRDLVANRHVRAGGQAESGIVVGDTAQHVGAGRQPFHNHHTDVIGMFVDEKMGNFRHNCLLNYRV